MQSLFIVVVIETSAEPNKASPAAKPVRKKKKKVQVPVEEKPADPFADYEDVVGKAVAEKLCRSLPIILVSFQYAI